MRALSLLVRDIDWQATVGIGSIRISPCVDQGSDGLEVAVARRPVQRRVAVLLRNVATRAGTEQVGDDLHAAPCGSAEQGRLANGIAPVHFRATLDELPNFLELSAPRDSVEC